MIQNRPECLMMSLLLVTVMAACSPSAAPVSEPPTATPIPAAEVCSNPLLPVRQGATWTHTHSSNVADPFTFTETISAVRADGFTLSSESAGVTRTQEWSCRAEGLLLLSLGGPGTAAMLSATGMSAGFTTSEVTGVTLPSNLVSGATWRYGFKVDGTVQLAEGQDVAANGTVTIDLTAIGSESVTVPAGTFEAMKIEAVPQFDLRATFQGIGVPVSFAGNSTLWFAPGIGWVKSEESAEIAGATFSSTTELQSFTIP